MSEYSELFVEREVMDKLDKKCQERMERLVRRHNFLTRRINESDKNLSFDRAERSALGWAINYIASDLVYED